MNILHWSINNQSLGPRSWWLVWKGVRKVVQGDESIQKHKGWLVEKNYSQCQKLIKTDLSGCLLKRSNYLDVAISSSIEVASDSTRPEFIFRKGYDTSGKEATCINCRKPFLGLNTLSEHRTMVSMAISGFCKNPSHKAQGSPDSICKFLSLFDLFRTKTSRKIPRVTNEGI